jgi:CRISPR/Cas system CMR subunit Cmr4 (Cas7 group RAMP superfamily)
LRIPGFSLKGTYRQIYRRKLERKMGEEGEQKEIWEKGSKTTWKQ